MAYEYRRLTAEDREAIRQYRLARGYPLHGPPHPYRHAGFYLINAANFEHAPVMADMMRRTMFETQLLTELANQQLGVFAWVILANHYHLLVSIEAFEQVSNSLKQLHGATAREWNLEDGLTGKRRVWYRFTDRRIRDEHHFYRVLNYIHYNPVRHNYVMSPYDWVWSSLDRYVETYGKDWLRKIWVSYHPGNIGEGWDDNNE